MYATSVAFIQTEPWMWLILIPNVALKAALQKLGYSVYHMSEACMRWEDKHLQLWREALDAKYNSSGLKPYSGANLEKILQNYTVSSAQSN